LEQTASHELLGFIELAS